MSIAHVQRSSELQVSSGTAGTVSITPAAGNALIGLVACSIDSNAVTTYTFSDSQGNAWVNDITEKSTVAFDCTAQVSHAFGAAGAATTVTLTCNHTNTFSAFVHEFSGIASLDVTDSNSQTGATSITMGSAGTATAAGDLVIGVLAYATSGSITPGGGFTGDTWAETHFFSQWQVFAGAATTACACTAGSATGTASAVAAYKATASTDDGGMLAERTCIAGGSCAVP